MSNIQSIETYTEIAKAFTLERFNQPLDIPIVINNRRRSMSGCFIYKRKGLEERKSHLRIELVTKKMKSHEEVVEILKHELCHWYCYTNHLDFSDGDVDFERVLYEQGVTSTHFGYQNKARSEFIQQNTINGNLKKHGFTNVQYKKADAQKVLKIIKDTNHSIARSFFFNEDSCERAKDVYLEGQYIGTIIKDYNGFVSLYDIDCEPKDVRNLIYRRRKDLVQELIYDYQTKQKATA